MRLLLAGLLLASGCAAPAPPPLSVGLDQSRDLENRHLLAVRLVNDGGAPVQVVRLQVRGRSWTTVPPTVREEVLEPGSALAFPVAYGVADCAQDGPSTLVVGYRRDGSLHEARVRVPASDPLLPRLHARECALAALGRTASVSFSPGWTRRGDVAVGELRLDRRRGGEPVAVTAVDGSVIFTLRATGALPVSLPGALPVSQPGPAARGTVRVPVEATPTRCDPHALAESKRTYDFSIAVVVGDAAPLTVTARPQPADLPLLQQLVRDVCL